MSERNPNFLIRSLNIDVLGVMKPQELVVKGVFDAAAGIAIGSWVFELITGPTPDFIENTKYALLSLGANLAINYHNRRYWMERLNR